MQVAQYLTDFSIRSSVMMSQLEKLSSLKGANQKIYDTSRAYSNDDAVFLVASSLDLEKIFFVSAK